MNSLLAEEEGKHVIHTLTHAVRKFIPLNTIGSEVKEC